jgi:hypothetical protein
MQNNHDPAGPTGPEGATGGTDCQETHLPGRRGDPARRSARRRLAADMTCPVTSPPYNAPVRSVRQAGVPCPDSDGNMTTAEAAPERRCHDLMAPDATGGWQPHSCGPAQHDGGRATRDVAERLGAVVTMVQGRFPGRCIRALIPDSIPVVSISLLESERCPSPLPVSLLACLHAVLEALFSAFSERRPVSANLIEYFMILSAWAESGVRLASES